MSTQNCNIPQRCIGFDLRALTKSVSSAAAAVPIPIVNEEVDYQAVTIKLEKENELLRMSNYKLNERLGDEILTESEDSILSDDHSETSKIVNTQYLSFDDQFSGEETFLTNVSFISKLNLT